MLKSTFHSALDPDDFTESKMFLDWLGKSAVSLPSDCRIAAQPAGFLGRSNTICIQIEGCYRAGLHWGEKQNTMEKPEQKNIEKNKYIFHLIAKTVAVITWAICQNIFWKIMICHSCEDCSVGEKWNNGRGGWTPRTILLFKAYIPHAHVWQYSFLREAFLPP